MIEVLKQALEALKDVGVLTDREWQAVHKNKVNELRQAIKELESQKPMARLVYKSEGSAGPPARFEAQPEPELWCMKMNGCKTKCEDCPDESPQPEQEPVAWQFMNGSNFRKHRPDDFVDLDSDGLPYWKPLYTTPPQRTWVGLANEDCEEVERWVEFKEEGSGRIPMGKLARYIEAKLKEKNT